jgi:hypothetical protein
MISLLITLLVVCVIAYVVKIILDMLNLPPPIKTILYLIFALVVIVYLVNLFVPGHLPILK